MKDKSYHISILAVLSLFIVADYIAIINYTDKIREINKFSIEIISLSRRYGAIFRIAFIFIFFLLSWNSYKNKLLVKKFHNTDRARYFLIVSVISLSTLFILIDKISPKINLLLYPVTFIVLIGIILLLITTFGEVISEEGGTVLGVEPTATEKDLSFVLAAEGGYVNITNPFRSIFVIGGAGSGKSYSIAEPIIDQAVQKGFSGVCYDVKFPTLADKVYTSFLMHKQKEVNFYSISFNDVSRSRRFNPLEPRLLKNAIYAEEYAYSLYSNLDKSMQKSGGENFFNASAVAVLKAVIWFLKKNHPEFCTIPHVVELILTASDKELVGIITSDSETSGFVKSVKEAAEKEALEQLAGVTGTLANYISRVRTKEFYWICTGNDFTLDLNNPLNPSFIVLGNALDVREAMNPIIAMIFTISLKLMNTDNKRHSIFVIDEGPTVQIPKLDQIPATARSNKVSVLYMAQDFSQMDDMYGKEKRKALVSNLAYQFYGNTSDLDTAKYVSEMIGEEYRSISSSGQSGSSSESGESSSRSVNYSQQKRKIIETSQVITLPQGKFVGKLVESQNNFFNAQLYGLPQKYEGYKTQKIKPFVKDFELTEEEIKIYKKEAQEVLKNINSHRGDGEINSIYISYVNKSKGVFPDSAKWLENEIEKLFYNRAIEDRKNKILLKNMEKITADVTTLIEKYMFI